MKKIIILTALTLISITNIFAQTKNDQARAYYIEAEKNYELNNYQSSLNNLNKVEEILGATNARVLALKVKSSYGAEDYINAKKYLNKFSNYDSSEALKNEILSYIVKVDNKLEEALSIKEREIIAENESKQAEAIDKGNWEKALSENNFNSFKNYLSNENNILFRIEAEKKIKRLFLATPEGIEKFIKENGHKDKGHALYKYNYSATVTPYVIKIKSQWRTMKNKIEYFTDNLYLEGEIELTGGGKKGDYYIWGPYGNRLITLNPNCDAVAFFEGLEAYVNSTDNKKKPKFITKL